MTGRTAPALDIVQAVLLVRLIAAVVCLIALGELAVFLYVAWWRLDEIGPPPVPFVLREDEAYGFTSGNYANPREGFDLLHREVHATLVPWLRVLVAAGVVLLAGAVAWRRRFAHSVALRMFP